MWRSHVFFMLIDSLVFVKLRQNNYGTKTDSSNFLAVSGFYVNCRKSMIYSVKEAEDIQTLAAILGCVR